jgi:predicted nucleic acid-binding protein
VPDGLTLVEPSIVFVEVLGTLARRVNVELAAKARAELDRMLNPLLTVDCDVDFCLRAYRLCREYEIYAVDSLYLATAIEAGSVLVSLDGEDFIDRVAARSPPIKALHVTQF